MPVYSPFGNRFDLLHCRGWGRVSRGSRGSRGVAGRMGLGLGVAQVAVACGRSGGGDGVAVAVVACGVAFLTHPRHV